MTLKFSKNLAVVMVAASTLLAGAASAQPLNAASDGSYQLAQGSYTTVLAALESSGYRVVEMKSTFLGRMKITAKNRVHLREIVVSRSTGEVKSDVIVAVFETVAGSGSRTARQTGLGLSTGTNATGGVGSGVGGAVGGVGGAAEGVGGAVGGAAEGVGGAVGGALGGLGLGG